jgi:hypothetical protein
MGDHIPPELAAQYHRDRVYWPLAFPEIAQPANEQISARLRSLPLGFCCHGKNHARNRRRGLEDRAIWPTLNERYGGDVS